MKTNIYINKCHLSIILIVMLWLAGINSAKSQWIPIHLAETNLNGSQIIQYDNITLNSHYLGIGLPSSSHPYAYFHIFEPLNANATLFKIEANGLGSIRNWYDTLGAKYGIYETSQLGISLNTQNITNYLQDRLCLGFPNFNEMLGVKGDIGLIKNDLNDTIHFNVYNVNGSVPTIAFRFHDLQRTGTPLTINNGQVTTQVFQTRLLQITQNPGMNKILVSDDQGNASWIDPGKYNDGKWMINNYGDLYANPSRKQVGIGFQLATDKIYQQLHILDGNILISRSDPGGTTTVGTGSLKGIKAPHSENGSILFGDVVNDKNTLGEWGIEYQTQNTDYNSNGLNFWKPFSSSSGGGDNYLYLRNDGNVGIGTSIPGDKLQVNDGLGRVVLGTGPGNVNPEFPPSNKKIGNKNQAQAPEMPDLGLGYIGFNANRNSKNQWELSSNGWDDAASLVYNDLNGDMYFCTIPSNGAGTGQILSQQDIYNKTKMQISHWGNITMGENISDLGDAGTDGTLTVRRRVECNIIADAMDMPSTTSPLGGGTGGAALWALTSRNGFCLSTDGQGVGHLEENFSVPVSFMSFYGGKVGIGDIPVKSYTNSICKLFVGGGILTEAVFVKLQSGGWPDFVFNKNNKLRPISELAQYIDENKHLPDVPTSADVKKDGVEVGKMDALLLQKVEELSLYVIELKKEITELQNKKSN